MMFINVFLLVKQVYVSTGFWGFVYNKLSEAENDDVDFLEQFCVLNVWDLMMECEEDKLAINAYLCKCVLLAQPLIPFYLFSF